MFGFPSLLAQESPRMRILLWGHLGIMHRSQDRQFDNMGPPVDEFADIPHVAEDEDDDDELTDAEKDKQAQRCLWVRGV